MNTAKFGSLSLPDIAVFAPAWYNGDRIEIRNTVSGRELKWVTVHGKFISTGIILSNISWFELHDQGLITGKEIMIDGQRYRCRSLVAGDSRTQPHEWDTILEVTGYDALVWYGDTCQFWCQGQPEKRADRIAQGGVIINNWKSIHGETKGNHIGFRPVLEPLYHGWPISKNMLNEKVTVFLPIGSVEGVVSSYTDYDLVLENPIVESWAAGLSLKWFMKGADNRGYISRDAIMHIQK